ncbi:MAG TPA: phage antirepressor protein [Candidatus Moranbacteria bacterium]|nr:phage antirepressor protein [Candidatus Moranbacteria bacterium]HBT45406.1 phage antirepressor protein [Candidatus Moranbacteria bacterium]
MKKESKNSLAIFEDKEIRKKWHNEEWWFAIVDVIAALTDSVQPGGYLKDMRRRDNELLKGWGQIATPLAINTSGGLQKINCANTEGLFRIIQSISSPKAEPFKLWLAKTGYERIQEIENPELAQDRMKQLYEQKGYPQDWIDKRLRGIAIRQNLTDEWKERNITSQMDFAILTAEISKATFGMTPSEYRKFKNIPGKSKINLRDNMTDLELIFTMLGERVTTEISEQEKPVGMPENKKVASRGGSIAGNARKETEKELGRPIVSRNNFLSISKKDKNLGK